MAELKDRELNEVNGGFIDSDDYTEKITFEKTITPRDLDRPVGSLLNGNQSPDFPSPVIE